MFQGGLGVGRPGAGGPGRGGRRRGRGSSSRTWRKSASARSGSVESRSVPRAIRGMTASGSVSIRPSSSLRRSSRRPALASASPSAARIEGSRRPRARAFSRSATAAGASPSSRAVKARLTLASASLSSAWTARLIGLSGLDQPAGTGQGQPPVHPGPGEPGRQHGADGEVAGRLGEPSLVVVAEPQREPAPEPPGVEADRLEQGRLGPVGLPLGQQRRADQVEVAPGGRRGPVAAGPVGRRFPGIAERGVVAGPLGEEGLGRARVEPLGVVEPLDGLFQGLAALRLRLRPLGLVDPGPGRQQDQLGEVAAHRRLLVGGQRGDPGDPAAGRGAVGRGVKARLVDRLLGQADSPAQLPGRSVGGVQKELALLELRLEDPELEPGGDLPEVVGDRPGGAPDQEDQGHRDQARRSIRW